MSRGWQLALWPQSCAGCHGASGQDGVGPRWPAPASTRRAQRPRFGPRGVMPAGLVTGQDEADVAAFVAQLAAR